MKTQQVEIEKLTQSITDKEVEFVKVKQSHLETERMLEDAQMQLLSVKSEIIEKDSQIE